MKPSVAIICSDSITSLGINALLRDHFNADTTIITPAQQQMLASCDPKRYDFIFDGLKKYKVHYDMIGLSVYPYWDIEAGLTKSWQESIEKATQNINRLWLKYRKPMMIVETGAEVKKP
ncbi:MAG: glycosyl hydrolase 53 family protein, partial [Muribaculaceae bacterium]|nr:glycosyl hydrolase 53 family protein [Muribaculaceae bacterium]